MKSILKTALLASVVLINSTPAFAQLKSKEDFSKNVQRFIAHDAPEYVITDVQIIDGTGATPVTGQYVVIKNGRIAEIGPMHAAKAPNVKVSIDGSGKTLMPGMVMLHEHMYYTASTAEGFAITENPITFPRLYLAGGVTTARTGGSIEPYTDLSIRDRINAGTMAGPNLDATAPYIEGKDAGIIHLAKLKDAKQAKQTVAYWADMGFTSFKAYMNLTNAQMKAAVDEAHSRGLKMTGHICATTYREAADIGIDNLEHGFWVATDFVADKPKDKCVRNRDAFLKASPYAGVGSDLIDHLIAKGVTLTSTLPVRAKTTSTFTGFPEKWGSVLTPRAFDQFNTRLKRVRDREGAVKSSDEYLQHGVNFEMEFVKRGGKLVGGSDTTGMGGTIAGYSNLEQIHLMVWGGFSLTDSIKTVTLNGARYLGRARNIGSIEVGKQADMVLINGDPTKNIRDIYKSEIVFKNGIGFDSAAIIKASAKTVGGPGPF